MAVKEEHMKHILITGAAGGIGSCLVDEYLKRGYCVFGADRVARSDAEQARAGQPYEFFLLDVTDTADVQRLAAELHRRTDSLDIILNCAGLLRPESEDKLEDFDIDGSMQVFNVNALGPFRIVKACIDLLRAGEDKLLLNMSSEAGSITTHADYIKRYDYCMSKAALNIQSVILQRYLKPEGIKVLLMHPGWVNTPMGGPEAPVTPEESARGIARVAEQMMHKPDSYMYWNYNGTERPW